MKKYSLVFLFVSGLDYVWLIRKNRPGWQKGCLNGVGGHVEDGETYMQAAIREVKEETGADIQDLKEIGEMHGEDFKVVVYAGITEQKLITTTDEYVGIFSVSDFQLDYLYIDNIPIWIQASICAIRSRFPFKKLIMEY